MLTMPAMGAYADLHARKKALLATSTAACVAGTAALGLAGGGDLWIAVADAVSNVCYSYGESLTAAFLPELARADSMGRVSGLGLELRLLRRHAVARAVPGLRAVGAGARRPGDAVRARDDGITAAVWGVASLATFALLRERAVPDAAAEREPT